MKLKLLVVFGTRADAIKMIPVIKALKKVSLFFDTRICVTGEQRDLLDQVLDLFEIKPHYDLNIMKKRQQHDQITSTIINGLGPIIDEFKPERILVYGDTTSALATTITAYYRKIPVAHIEAGLRSGHLYSPWPEEGNRKSITALADLHFAPTESAKNHLLREGVSNHCICVTGNTIIDGIIAIKEKIETQKNLKDQLNMQYPFLNDDKKLLIFTGPRREFGHIEMSQLTQAIVALAKEPNVEIIYPIKLETKEQRSTCECLMKLKNVHLTPPTNYLPFVYLMTQSYLIISDSGNIQEEASALDIPVLLTRDVTDRPELLETGAVKMVELNAENIIKETKSLLSDSQKHEHMKHAQGLYGDGQASFRIVQELISRHKKSEEN